MKLFAKNNNKTVYITGMRAAEGGQRVDLTCTSFNKDNVLKSFHPLAPVTDSFIDWFIDEYKISLCELYNAPYNFTRTGCKGCPFSLHLKEQLETMSYFMPEERKQCETIWKPVYDEYRRIKYRLNDEQPLLF